MGCSPGEWLHCADIYSPTRASVRAGNGQQAQAFGEDRLWWPGRAEGLSAPKVTLLDGRSPSIRPDRHEGGLLRI
jgi:hypothetical protein